MLGGVVIRRGRNRRMFERLGFVDIGAWYLGLSES